MKMRSIAALSAAAVSIFCATPNTEFVEAFSPAFSFHLHTSMQHNCRIGTALGLLQGQSGTMPGTVDIIRAKHEIASKGGILTGQPDQISEAVFEESVPSTWTQALHRFFIGDVGPPLVVLSISGFIFTRLQLPIQLSVSELTIFALSIFVWWIQEYCFHRILLHSHFNWMGKSIHQTHHSKKYFHVSIDPPELLLGWLFAAHLILKSMLPWHVCLSATVGYALAGLVYEWSHYIVHTKVKPPSQPSGLISPILSKLFSQMRDNHIRHHLVDDQYWYAFSVPAMDDLFQTNPDVREVIQKKKKEK